MVNFISIIKNDVALCPTCYNKCTPNYKIYESEYAFLANDEDAQKLFFSKENIKKKECTECNHTYFITQKKSAYTGLVTINIPLKDFISLEEKYVYKKKKQSLERYLPEDLKKKYSIVIETLQSMAPEEAKKSMIKEFIKASLTIQNQANTNKNDEDYIINALRNGLSETLKATNIKINKERINSRDALELIELHLIRQYKMPKYKEEADEEYNRATKEIKIHYAKTLESIEDEIKERVETLKHTLL